MVYNNFSGDAAWMARLYTKAQWLDLYSGNVPHPIFQVAGVTHFSVEPDELHIMYLGTVQYMLGSILYLLVYKKMASGPGANMREVWSKISAYYRQHRVPGQFSNLLLSSFCDPKRPHHHFPRLKGKGA